MRAIVPHAAAHARFAQVIAGRTGSIFVPRSWFCGDFSLMADTDESTAPSQAGDGPAIVSEDGRLSLQDFDRAVERAARGLRAIGLGETDRLALLMRNDVEMLIAATAAGQLGAYAVPINWHFAAPEILYILENSEARALVIHADLLRRHEGDLPTDLPRLTVETPPALRRAYRIGDAAATVPEGETDFAAWREGFEPLEPEPIQPPGSIIYTSGTTGRPKGVRRFPVNAEQYQEQLGTLVAAWGFHRQPVRTVMTGPMYHSAPFNYGVATLKMRGSLVLPARFDPEGLLADIARHKITHLHMVPTMFVRLLKLPDDVKRRYDLSSLQFVVHSAAPCPPEVKAAMLDWWGDVIWEYYGSTELGIVTLIGPEDWRARPTSVGRPADHVDVRILGSDGAELPPGPKHLGEVFARNAAVADFTYHRDEDKRRAAERAGYLTCGDMGYLDADGYLHLAGRSHDMVISGGVNIYPAEIEAALHDLPGVHDCAVFGVPDAEFGERLVAVIQPDPGAHLEPPQIQAGLKDRIARYKIPRQIEFRPDLPREDTGKIFKRKLREAYL